MPKVLVTDAGGRNVVAAVRSLGKKGINVVCADEMRIALSACSKYSGKYLRCPSPKTAPDRWLRWLLQELASGRYDMVMPMGDETTEICSRNKQQIAKLAKVPVADFDVFSRAGDKATTIQIAMRTGVPYPKTVFPADPKQLEGIAGQFDFPVVIKPRHSSGSRGIIYVRRAEELSESYLKVHTRYPLPMVQEFIPPGGQACGVFLMFNKKAEVRALFAHKRLREFPLSGGPSTLRESVHLPELTRLSIKMLQAMNWYGVAMAEFKQDPRDGQFKLMEINPRFWGSLQLSILAGVDFPYLLYRMETDGDVQSVTDYPAGIRCRWLLPGDILHFILNPQRFKMNPSFFDFSKNNRQDDFISLSDPGPTIGFFLMMVANLFSAAKWKHVFGR